MSAPASRFTVVLIDAPPELAEDGDFVHVVGVSRDELEAAAVGAPWLAALAEAAAGVARADRRAEIHGAAVRAMDHASAIPPMFGEDVALVAAFALAALEHDAAGELEHELERETTATGHVIGAVYRSFYWGGTYRVIGRAGEWGVEVECVTPGAGAHQTIGERWRHATALDPRDEEVQGG